MAIKKSQLYSMLWSGCDALRGSMDASQYKNYVLTILFVKYLSDKQSDPDFEYRLPEDCTFRKMKDLIGKKEIGDQINKKLQKIEDENESLKGVLCNSDIDFNNEQKFGAGDELTNTVSELLRCFDLDELDFSKNRAADDDLIGDAYEFLMRNFASASGKDKGQFYTPQEVSRTMAKLLGINNDPRNNISIYDPTCGSGSLLLRAKAEAREDVTVSLHGQEKDNATIGMAKMSMIIHGDPYAQLIQGNTLQAPKFIHGSCKLDTFDYIVANPPFSAKKWQGSLSKNDLYSRWSELEGYAPMPPDSCGDYAFLLHIVASLNTEGKGACILPHGVLFRGNVEAEIRRHLINNSYISGIIGLPPNLFYGTGIPACIIIIDKQTAYKNKGIFYIDAKDLYAKDGAKNRLREQDIKLIVDTWNNHVDVPHFARFVSYSEIKDVKNDYNLNIPRYITPRDTEIVHDIEAHISGGLPRYDIDTQMDVFFDACNTLKSRLFRLDEKGYYQLNVSKNDITATIEQEPSFVQQCKIFNQNVKSYISSIDPDMQGYGQGSKPKEFISKLGDKLLVLFIDSKCSLVEPYNIYQVLMTMWQDFIQDDCYMVKNDGWTLPKLEEPKTKSKEKKSEDKNNKIKVKVKKNYLYTELANDLLPVSIVIDEYFSDLDARYKAKTNHKEELESKVAEMDETYQEEFSEILEEDDKSIANLKSVQKQLQADKDKNAIWLLEYIKNKETIEKERKEIKALNIEIIEKLKNKYKELDSDTVKELVIEKKWKNTFADNSKAELSRITQSISASVSALVSRYECTLKQLSDKSADLENKVMKHLNKMGFQF